ncbi:MAG: hypothetical protein ACXIUD_14440 [Mongoliitalea sp.]
MDKVLIKRIVIGLIVIFFLMIATLGLHIYLVTKSLPVVVSSISMERIDFQKPLDSLQASLPFQKIKDLNGVKYFQRNSDSGNLGVIF